MNKDGKHLTPRRHVNDDGEDDDVRDDEEHCQYDAEPNGDNGHWVEKLFPPSFAVTVDQILAEIDQEQVPVLSSFDKYAGNPDTIQPSDIKNVYERVWLMQAIAQDKQRAQQQDDVCSSRATFTLDRDSHSVQMRHAATTTCDLQNHIRETEDNDCIWNSDEISVLREAFQAARHESKQMKTRLALTTDRHDTMSAKQRKQQCDLDTCRGQLHEASKANNRLHILSRSLHAQVKATERQVSSLRLQLDLVRQQSDVTQQEAQQARLQCHRERMQKEALQLNNATLAQEAATNQARFEESVKATHALEANALRRRVLELETELTAERESHARSQRGLQHLRTHFASLPYSEHASQGMVTEDQLKNWQL